MGVGEELLTEFGGERVSACIPCKCAGCRPDVEAPHTHRFDVGIGPQPQPDWNVPDS